MEGQPPGLSGPAWPLLPLGGSAWLAGHSQGSCLGSNYAVVSVTLLLLLESSLAVAARLHECGCMWASLREQGLREGRALPKHGLDSVLEDPLLLSENMSIGCVSFLASLCVSLFLSHATIHTRG